MPTPDSQHPPSGNSEVVAFFAAVRDQDLDALRRLLEATPALTEARINESAISLRGEPFVAAVQAPLTEKTSTALHLAANSFLEYGQDAPKRTTEIVQLLLEHGADPDGVGYNENTDHCTPIVIAAWEGGLEKMRLLLDAGADVTGEMGGSALSTAANHSKTDRLDLLIEYGAVATPWMLVHAGLTQRVLALVDADRDLLTQSDDGYTLMQAAAARTNRDAGEGLPEAGRELALALIKRGAEVDVFAAAALDDTDRLRQLLAADPPLADARLPDGKTPVAFAVDAGSTEALQVLLEAGADANTGVLKRAARLDDTEACRLLIEHGASVTDEAVLEAAWRNSDPACLALMLDNGGNPSAVSGRGTLHWVAGHNLEAVRLLIDAGADVNMRAPGAMNNTPLHHAAIRPEITALLLEAGADPTLQNDSEDLPVNLAENNDAQEVVALLRAAMGR